MCNGNIWHAVTECIEQRQKAFQAIKEQGNFLREDIVTYLTAHHGNAELALNELNRLQLKPFLLKIIGAPTGADNNSGNNLMNSNQQAQETPSTSASPMKKEKLDGSNESNEEILNAPNNNVFLRDIEAIITSMEEKQSKQNETILHTIENLFGNMMSVAQSSRPLSNASSFSTLSFDRLDVKSPIAIPSKSIQQTSSDNVENDVRSFVSRHIQDISPHVAVIVNKELTEAAAKTASVENSWNQKNLNDTKQNEMTAEINGIRASSSENVIKTDVFDDGKEVQLPNNVEDKRPIQATLLRNPENSTEASSSGAMPTEKKTNKNRTGAGANFLVNKGVSRYNIRQAEKKRVREFEKQFIRQEKQGKNYMNLRPPNSEERSDSRNTANLSDSTIINDEGVQASKKVKNVGHVSKGSHNGPNINFDMKEVKTFSLLITEQDQAETFEPDYSRSLLDLSDAIELLTASYSEQASNVDDLSEFETDSVTWTNSNLALLENNDNLQKKENRNISEMVQHTKNIIKQMKNEIDEDIAMSEFDDYDGSDYNENDDELIALDDSDGWTDIDDDQPDFDDNNHDEYEATNSHFERSSESMESEQFEEAREEFSLAEQGNTFQSLNGSVEGFNSEREGSIDDIEPLQFDVVDDRPEQVPNLELTTLGNSLGLENDMSAGNAGVHLSYTAEASRVAPIPISQVANEETIIEIQQSLQSGIITLNKGEGPKIEKSTSPESNNFTPTPDSISPLPVVQNYCTQLTINDLIVTNDKQENIQEQLSVSPIPSISIESPDIQAEEYVRLEHTVHSQTAEFLILERLENFVSDDLLQNESTDNLLDITTDKQQRDTETNVTVVQHERNIEEELEVTEEDEEGEEREEGEEEETEEEIETEESVETDEESVEDQKREADNSPSNTTESIDKPGPSKTPEPNNNAAKEFPSRNDSTEDDVSELSSNNSSNESKKEPPNETPAGKANNFESKETLIESYQYKKITIPVLTDCCQSSINLLQLEKVEHNHAITPTSNVGLTKTASKLPKNKIPVRRLSASEPSASIKQIQNELLNKNTSPAPKNPGKKPSKIVPPKLFFKSGFTALTNKVADLILPNKGSAINNEKKPKENGTSKLNFNGKTENGPKKKYFETCFSDDYQTSDDETAPNTTKRAIPNLLQINEVQPDVS